MEMVDKETIHIADSKKDELHLILDPDRLDEWFISHQGYDKVEYYI